MNGHNIFAKDETYSKKGDDLIMLEKYEESIVAYDLAIKFQPAFAEAYYNHSNE